ncbi:LysR family transcriptional regulator [Streptomyces sp. JJ66]|uniref:LysR family transcriptional regulator n=1 Tax=Streptomyces sp. JJ66 TaxID=2803843 RepID=UPI001C5746AA|nr:LysR family transcriptional regulator [Streptomyces sp. JJ66]MBW1602675.1 LysR family transcriptional regulator [Streptomyces sp. JJ66]
MELQQLRYVVAVAETGGFTRAAERCHVVQSALSHQIAKLERELGARLFERTSRRVRLTAAGEAVLPAARQALEAAERARAEVAAALGQIRGRLSIGTISTVTVVDLPSLLGVYRTEHPQVRVSLVTWGSEVLATEVREGALDLAFLGVPPEFVARGVASRTLLRDEHVAVVAPDHPLAGVEAGTPVGLRRLAQEVFVDFPTGTAARDQSDGAFTRAGLRREVACEVTSVDTLAALVRNGLGVATLPAAFVPRLAGVRVLALRDAPVREERLVWSPDRLSPAAAAFLRTLVPDTIAPPPDATPSEPG